MSGGKPRQVILLALGGTIATAPDARGHAAPAHGATAIVQAAGSIPDIEINSHDIGRISSRAVTPATMLDVATAAARAYDEATPPDGVVITHGTDTLEETAYFLALTLSATWPIVLTGAMRRPDEPGADGPANVRAALRVAASDDAAGRGPLVLFGDEVHAARWVTKVHTSRVTAFASPETGPLGLVSEGRVLFSHPARPDPPLGLPQALPHRVEVLWTYTGADALVADAIAPHVDGLVIAGTGGGHAPPAMANSLARLAGDGMPIVLATRCAAGPTLRHTYAGHGSETHLLEAGLLPAGRLSPIKARLRLLVALALGLSPATVFPVD